MRTLKDFGFKDPIGLKRYKMTKRGLKMVNEEHKDEDFQKIENVIFKFEKEGDTITGKLLSIEDSAIHNNKVYKIETSVEIVTIFGTTVLDSQLSGIPIGKTVRIILTGSKPAKTKGWNDVKLFDVYVSNK